ncbi:MAG: DNA polymerase III subunit delta' [Acidobacteria bacterium]|nr:DNA polymerase III subunit delta' [Acidobacteriota bacterium]
MTFRDTVGHRRLLGLLARAIKSGSLPPSLVFAGPDGVGKKRVALTVAQAMNCLSPVEDAAAGLRDACGTCISCRKIERGLHPDVKLVAPEDNGSIKIEPIREVVGQTAYRPFEGRARVVVIDQADLMGEDAQNALLKTLEEPPLRNVFILVTARPMLLLDTVRSRCCQLRFAPLASGEIATALMARHGFAEREARAAAALAGGSLGRAIESATGEMAEARAVATAILIEATRAADARGRLAVGAALLQTAGKKGKEKDGKGQASDRGALAVRLRALSSLLRDVTLLTTRAPEQALVNLDLRAELEPVARYYDRDRLVRAFSAVGRALAALERHNASPKIVVDWLAFQL